MSEEREVLVREFPVELSEDGDGRTLEARIVPYNTKTRVADAPTYEPYEEMFLPGTFERQTRAPDRLKIWLNFEHEQGLRGIVGHGISLEEREDALYGTFRMRDDPDGNKALGMVRDGLLTGISIEFNPLKSKRVGGIVQRVRAHLDKVSLVRVGAYSDAQVLALREEPDPEPEPDPAPDPDPAPSEPSEAALALERIGYEPLLHRAVTRKLWKGDAARFADDEYERSCLVCRPGDGSPKERCSLPVLEPDGSLNANALGAAAAALAGARGGLRGVSPEQKATAARKLRRLYSQAEMEPPASLMAMASR